MLADPMAIAARSPTPAVNLAVIRADGYGSERRDVNGLYSAIINHSNGRNGTRHYLQMKWTKDATNPYSGLVTPQTASVSIALQRPAYGFTASEMDQLWLLAYDAYVVATTAKLLNFQS